MAWTLCTVTAGAAWEAALALSDARDRKGGSKSPSCQQLSFISYPHAAYLTMRPMQSAASDLKAPSRSYLRTQMFELPPSVRTLHFCKTKKKQQQKKMKTQKWLILWTRQPSLIALIAFFLSFFFWLTWTFESFFLLLPAPGRSKGRALGGCARARAVVRQRLWMSCSCAARWSVWTADEWSGNY